jgi:hypothetical protein
VTLFQEIKFYKVNKLVQITLKIFTEITYSLLKLSPVYTTLNFWYGTDKIGTRTTFLALGLPKIAGVV